MMSRSNHSKSKGSHKPAAAGHKFLLAMIAGAVLGAVFGILSPGASVKIGFLGEFFLNALKMMVLPLIITSMVVGVTSLGDVRKLGSIGIKTVLYYLVTTGLAVFVGICLVVMIQPGTGFEAMGSTLPEGMAAHSYSVKDVLLGLIHPNLIQAAADFQILPLIIASLLFGVAVTLIGEKGMILVDFFDAANDAVMLIVHGIIFFTPLGIFALIASRLGEAGGGQAFWEVLSELGAYCATVLLGLVIHGIIILPAILFFIGKRNPVEYAMNLAKAILTSFATSSSSATLPVTMECVQEEAKVSERVSDVVLPIGATVNMDGTALYEAVAAIFIAQSYGITLGPGHLVVVFLTATLAAIGAAGIPQAGLVTMVLVLQAVGLPAEGIGLILAVDWFLDRCRTTVNVWGDAVGAAVVDRLENNQ